MVPIGDITCQHTVWIYLFLSSPEPLSGGTLFIFLSQCTHKLSFINSQVLPRYIVEIKQIRIHGSGWFHFIGPCNWGYRDSGFKFQTDQGFRIRISKEAGFWFLGFKFQSNFLGFIFKKRHGFWIQISKGSDSGFRFALTGPFS